MPVKRVAGWTGQGPHNEGVRYFVHEVRPQGYLRLWFLCPDDPDEGHFQPCARQDIPSGWSARQVAKLMRQHSDELISSHTYYLRLSEPPKAQRWHLRFAALLRIHAWG